MEEGTFLMSLEGQEGVHYKDEEERAYLAERMVTAKA